MSGGDGRWSDQRRASRQQELMGSVSRSMLPYALGQSSAMIETVEQNSIRKFGLVKAWTHSDWQTETAPL